MPKNSYYIKIMYQDCKLLTGDSSVEGALCTQDEISNPINFVFKQVSTTDPIGYRGSASRRLAQLGSILLITAITSLFPVQARAEMESQEKENMQPLSTAEVFEKAFFDHTGNAFQNDSIVGQLNHIFGFNLFPEKQIALDGKLVDILYRDVMKTQAEAVTPMKTRDLSNPYSTSLQENHDYIGY